MAAAAGSLWRGETERELERALEARRITQSRIRELQAQKEHHGGYLAQLNERVAVLTRHIGEYRAMLERGLGGVNAPELKVPADAPAAPAGCEWRHSTLVREGALLYMGDHDVFGKRETFFHRVVKIEEKPKTFTATLVPTHPRMVGSEQRRWRKDEWLLVRAE